MHFNRSENLILYLNILCIPLEGNDCLLIGKIEWASSLASKPDLILSDIVVLNKSTIEFGKE